ncbi:MAG: uracil-DNA glycosylase [Arsenophonus sp. ET-YP4-MAG3]
MSFLPIWQDIIRIEKKQNYFYNIFTYIIEKRRQGINIFPPQKDLFNAFYYTKLNKVKVVILGQDPYHTLNQAHGLSFSVQPGIPVPPSLLNIYKELTKDILYFQHPNHGYLISWAKQGILLLNTILTVEEGKPYSHAKLGWEIFTNKIISVINQYRVGVIFLLWGSNAQKKCKFIDNLKHFILKASHPSPLSAHKGFFNCRHFSKTNEMLIKQGIKPIDWMSITKK